MAKGDSELYLIHSRAKSARHHLVSCGAAGGTLGFLQVRGTLLTREPHPQPRFSIILQSPRDPRTVRILQGTASLTGLKDVVVPA